MRRTEHRNSNKRTQERRALLRRQSKRELATIRLACAWPWSTVRSGQCAQETSAWPKASQDKSHGRSRHRRAEMERGPASIGVAITAVRGMMSGIPCGEATPVNP